MTWRWIALREDQPQGAEAAVEVRQPDGRPVGFLAVRRANLPPDAYPVPLQVVSNVLPLRHGLTAIRNLLAGTPSFPIIRNAMLEATVGLAWLGLSLLLFHRFAEGGRRDGSIEYAS